MQNKKSTIIKDAVALFAIALVAALALGFVYEITKGPIADAAAKAKAEAYAAVYPEAVKVDAENEELNKKVEESAEFLAANGFDSSRIDEVCIGKDANDKAIGYVMTITSTAGFGGEIKFSLGIKADGTLTKMEILEISETSGLGSKATEDEFKGQFSDVKTDAFTLIKNGEAKADNTEINAISGATITSTAVTTTVNAGLAFANELLSEGIGGVVSE
ncbi:MAG: RnfABCDGE type electron transport complex subunit G [Clostridiales bacterium]|nr:RnfABCDGE type electron transport complex subunit G [Clostridiales bacterium]